jgi:D-alanyl-D-alanine carboxypeptidase (penicillin-binding protein 5/6)
MRVLFFGFWMVASVWAQESGPPYLSAKAWLLVDGESGAVLRAEGKDEPMKGASTTKMMTLSVVLDLVDADEGVLDEVLTASAFAAGTKGSRAGLKEGDRVRIGDALYGLMLPSGNDMANALAEHFSERLAAPDGKSPEVLGREVYATRANFIAEMNRRAKRLGMENTVYTSALGDGLTAVPTTTAWDLSLLAREGMGRPRFAEVVGTGRWEAEIEGADGSRREVVWENSNELLGVEGFGGVKTGTTTTAGACLVASGVFDGRWLVGVVLGSSGSKARYADMRNLFFYGVRGGE